MPIRARFPSLRRAASPRVAYATGATLAAVGTYTVYRTFTSTDDDPSLPVDAAALYYSAGTSSSSALRMDSSAVPHHGLDRPSSTWTPPTREEMLASLGCPSSATPRAWPGLEKLASKVGLERFVPQSLKEGGSGSETAALKQEQVLLTSEDDAARGEFDLLVVGGGATGAGVALDAASRGLRVGLVERDDFSSGRQASRGSFLPGRHTKLTWLTSCHNRNLIQIDQARSRWCALPAKGRV